MTPERWQELKAVFGEAQEASPEQREQIIAAASLDLIPLLRRLLDADQSQGFLDRPLMCYEPAMEPVHAFEPGDRLCDRFQIVRFIARGGMGEVYEAYDRSLREPVALKTVRSRSASSQASDAFRREVRRARAVTSHHVCRVHDLFTHQSDVSSAPVLFLSMRLLNGETLAARIQRQGKLNPQTALPLLRDIAEGIDAAHREHIVHGDLKSGNVMLTTGSDGKLSACITDFGLARRIAYAADDGETLTEDSPRGGTPAWMAPEQVEGAVPGVEADIYAFGLIAYEMVTGRLPFDGATPEEAARRRLKDPPYPARTFSPQLPVRWERALMRCLDRNPSKRFSSATAFIDALAPGYSGLRGHKWPLVASVIAILGLSTAVAWQPARQWIVDIVRPAAQDRSVAVMPFERLGSTPEYFADGFTEEVIHALGQVHGIRILGPESSFYFKSSNLPPREIAHRLGVRYLLTGSVGRLEKDLRVIVRLIDSADGSQLWSRGFTRNEQDLFLARDDVARAVANGFRLSLAGMDVPAQAIDPAGLSARDLYWTGRVYLRQRSDSGVISSLEYFRQAVARDASFAPAYCGMADALFVAAERDLIPPGQALAEAKAAATRAMQLDHRLPEAWLSLAQVTSIYDHDLDRAEQYFRHALQLDPRAASAWQWYSYQLVKQRRFPEAISAGEAAVTADPLSLPANINLAVVYLYAGDDDRAVEQCRKLTQMDPQLFFEHPMVALVFARKGLTGEAMHEMEQIPDTRRNHRITLRVWVEVYALAGLHEQAEQGLARLLDQYARGGIPPSYVAAGYAAVGDKDRAIEWLSRALAVRDAFASVANAYPAFEALRSDPRFIALMEQLGIKAQTGSGSAQRQ